MKKRVAYGWLPKNWNTLSLFDCYGILESIGETEGMSKREAFEFFENEDVNRLKKVKLTVEEIYEKRKKKKI